MPKIKPLLGVVTYNRMPETQATLESLTATGAFDQAEVVVFDNGSDSRMVEWLMDWADEYPRRQSLILTSRNMGCPRALNHILKSYRRPGQHFIKVDNDVRLLTPGWVEMLAGFLDAHPAVALASAWYDELNGGHGRKQADLGSWEQHFPIVGHCAIHAGAFLDRAGFFDVLAPDHLYGFEDTLMCYRAAAAGGLCAVVKAVKLENLQRHNSLDAAQRAGAQVEDRQTHVERMRRLYEWRIGRIRAAGGRYRVNANGEIA